jgi:hypothetical protein
MHMHTKERTNMDEYRVRERETESCELNDVGTDRTAMVITDMDLLCLDYDVSYRRLRTA